MMGSRTHSKTLLYSSHLLDYLPLHEGLHPQAIQISLHRQAMNPHWRLLSDAGPSPIPRRPPNTHRLTASPIILTHAGTLKPSLYSQCPDVCEHNCYRRLLHMAKIQLFCPDIGVMQ